MNVQFILVFEFYDGCVLNGKEIFIAVSRAQPPACFKYNRRGITNNQSLEKSYFRAISAPNDVYCSGVKLRVFRMYVRIAYVYVYVCVWCRRKVQVYSLYGNLLTRWQTWPAIRLTNGWRCFNALSPSELANLIFSDEISWCNAVQKYDTCKKISRAQSTLTAVGRRNGSIYSYVPNNNLVYGLKMFLKGFGIVSVSRVHTRSSLKARY